MRRAELVMALVMTAFSAYLMWKSAELPIGWIEDEGPGGGAWPFWLAAIMLGCSIWTLARWFRGVTVPSRSDQPYMDGFAIKAFVMVAGALAVSIGLIHVIGVYFAIPLFIVFYLRVIGRHMWTTTVAIAAAVPVVTFFFFDVAMRIVLPKGYTEPLFYPLYDIFL